MTSRRKRFAYFVAAAAVTTSATLLVSHSTNPSPYTRYQHPTQPLAIVIYRQPILFALPGSSSDAPARIALENSLGDILESTQVESLLVVSEPEWSETRVEMKLVFDWKLPAAR